MKDTPDYVADMQHKIFFALPMHERVRQGVEMVDFGMNVLENSIRQQYPNCSPLDFRIEKLKRLYANDLPAERLSEAIEAFRARLPDWE